MKSSLSPIAREVIVVKRAFQAAGFNLAFSRSRRSGGYYLPGQPALSPELSQVLKNSVSEVDPRQYRILQENPEMTPAEANRMALQRAYSK